MKFWKQRISYFLEKHSDFIQTEEKIFTPKNGIKVKFWFEGNLQIEGSFNNLQINYNDDNMLVLATEQSIFRIPWKRLICFEIIKSKDISKEMLDILNSRFLNKN